MLQNGQGLVNYCFFYMKEEKIVRDYFNQFNWHSIFPPANLIPSQQHPLSPADIQFLTNDDTNPSIDQFPLTPSLSNTIQHLNGAVFIKAAGRTAKDTNLLDRRITSVRDMVMLVKMSEYLTQALCQEKQQAVLVIRQYLKELQSGHDQFRGYVIGGRLVGLCQKDPSFLGTEVTQNQLKAVRALVLEVMKKVGQEDKNGMVIEVYCSPNGKELKVLGFQPFHIHPLSLFAKEELFQHAQKGKGTLTKIVQNEAQLKTTDLREYRPGAELANLQNATEWINFMQRQNEKQQSQS